MDTTTSVAATAVIVAVGEWSKPVRKLSIRNVVGFMVLALFLAGLSSANEELGRKFAALILVASLLTYAVPISKKLGFTK